MTGLAFGFAQPALPPIVTLREYQSDSLTHVRTMLDAGTRRVLLVAPTGSGKTVVFAALAADAVRAGDGVLVLAHRRELIDQTFAKLLAAGVPRELIGVVMASDARRNPGAPVQVASVDTLRNWVGKRSLPRAKWVIVDEAHRAAAQSYRSILSEYPDAYILGLTATPWRLDGQGLADMFDDLVVVATISELTAQGFLVPLRCYSHPSRPNLSDVRVRAGEFAEEDLVRVMRSSLLLGSIPEQYRARAHGRSAFGFAVNVEHAHELAKVCTEAGIRSEAISAETDPATRAQALVRLRTGDLSILWNVGLFTEGTDVEEVKCIILARPTLSKSLAFQMIGRGMRPFPSTGFSDCVVLDHAGVLQIHGHPLEAQDYSLTAKKRKGPLSAALTKDCPQCNAIVPLGTVTCECGYVWERAERAAPEQVEGDLVELAPKAKPPVILSPSAEEQLCRRALAKAIELEATNPIRYATSVLERQLRRSPDLKILGRVAIALLGTKTQPPEPKERPEWLKRSLGIPIPAPLPPPEPPRPVVQSDEETIEVAFG